MAVSREKISHERRLESHIDEYPDFVKEYVRAKKRAKYSPSTLLGYIYEFKIFFEWLQKEGISNFNHMKDTTLDTLENLSKKNVEYYIEYLSDEIISVEAGVEKKRSIDAVNRNINALKSLFNYLTTETEIEETGECYFYRNVFNKVKLFKKEETANRRAAAISSVILNDNEINNFLEYLKNEYGIKLSKQKKTAFLRDKERDIAIISMVLGSGVRVSEIASLTLKEINFQKMQIDIVRKGNKADTADVISSALEDLKEYLRIREVRYPGSKDIPYVFVTVYGKSCRPLSVRAIQDLVNKYTKAFNSREEFANGKSLSPHKLRHSFASEWIRNGGNIVLLRDQLGHNSIETTQKYTNLSSEERRKVINEMEKSRK